MAVISRLSLQDTPTRTTLDSADKVLLKDRFGIVRACDKTLVGGTGWDIIVVNEAKDLPTLESAVIGKTYLVRTYKDIYTCLQSEMTVRAYSITAKWRDNITETEGGIDYYTIMVLNKVLTNSSWVYSDACAEYNYRAMPLQVGDTYYLAPVDDEGNYAYENTDHLIYAIPNASPTIDIININTLTSESNKYIAISVDPTVPQTQTVKYWLIINASFSTEDVGTDTSGSSTDDSGSTDSGSTDSGDSGDSGSNDSGSTSGETYVTGNVDSGLTGGYQIYVTNESSTISSMKVEVLDTDLTTSSGAWNIQYGGILTIKYDSKFVLRVTAVTVDGTDYYIMRETNKQVSSAVASGSSCDFTMYTDSTDNTYYTKAAGS